MAEKKGEVSSGGPPEVLYVFNLYYDTESHSARRLRPGNMTGFLLDNGRRIRSKGRHRLDEVSLADVVRNLDKLVDGVRRKYVEVYLDGDGRQLVTAEMLEDLRPGKARGRPHGEKPLPPAEKKPAESPPAEKKPEVNLESRVEVASRLGAELRPARRSLDDLMKLNRADLDEEARKAGVERPEDHKTKRELADAILERGR